MSGEILASVLLTHHNLGFFLDTMRRVRQSIRSGDFPTFRRDFTERLSARAGDARFLPRFLPLLGELAACFGEANQVRQGLEVIEETLARLEEIVVETGMVVLRPFMEVERAELTGLAGDAAGRRARLAEAHRLFRAMGATGHAERLARELAA